MRKELKRQYVLELEDAKLREETSGWVGVAVV
jgi:hypothetical protein